MPWLYLIALWGWLVPIGDVVLKQRFTRLNVFAYAPTTVRPGHLLQGFVMRAVRLTIGIFLALWLTLKGSWHICSRCLAQFHRPRPDAR
jgi:hypothetical protein